MLNSPQQPSTTLGWDVGGAHLKAVLINAQGNVLHVLQLPCPLWRGVDVLIQAVQSVLGQMQVQLQDEFQGKPQLHAVTMTGELADIFEDRSSGVLEIADIMSQLLPGKVKFYAGNAGFVAIADVAFHTQRIASANWLASSSLLARELNEGLFIDIGSTTADLAILENSKPQVRGYDDAARMQFEELLYTGVVRTPLTAITRRISFEGEWTTVAAEHFATTADVYRLTGELDSEFDVADTADGKGKSSEESARRLARMLGRDSKDFPMEKWMTLAQAFRQAQLESLQQAVLRALSRQLIAADAPLIGAGAGSFLVKRLAIQLQRPYIEAASVVPGDSAELRMAAAVCMPAYAVAALSADSHDSN